MAKVTVDDKISPESDKALLPKTRAAIHQGVLAALERIGDAYSLIEMIKVAPTDIFTKYQKFSGLELKELCETVNVKIVIGLTLPTENRPTPIKVEKNMRVVFDNAEKKDPEEIIDLIQQVIVRYFQNEIAGLIQVLLRKSEDLRATLSDLRTREFNSGNNVRCDKCGCGSMSFTQRNGYRFCGRCQPHLIETALKAIETEVANKPPTDSCPTCPNCGHVTVRNGACFKCNNCGDSVGCT